MTFPVVLLRNFNSKSWRMGAFEISVIEGKEMKGLHLKSIKVNPKVGGG